MMKRLVLILVFFSIVLFAEAQTQITDISHIDFTVLSAGELDILLRHQTGVRCTLDQNSINKLDREVKRVFWDLIRPGKFFAAYCIGIHRLTAELRINVTVIVYIQFIDYDNNWVYWAYYQY
jgi:hypothetical protein